jgi:hypothetical protein
MTLAQVGPLSFFKRRKPPSKVAVALLVDITTTLFEADDELSYLSLMRDLINPPRLLP